MSEQIAASLLEALAARLDVQAEEWQTGAFEKEYARGARDVCRIVAGALREAAVAANVKAPLHNGASPLSGTRDAVAHAKGDNVVDMLAFLRTRCRTDA